MVIPTRPVVLLCVLLLSSGALAGCTDKKDKQEDGPQANPFTRLLEDDDPETIDDYVRLYSGNDPGTCEGCIKLDGDPEPIGTTPTHQIRPGHTVPLPRIGDHLELHGQRGAATGDESGGVPTPVRATGEYSLRLHVAGLTTEPHTTGPAAGTHARVQFTSEGGSYRLHGHPFTPYDGTLLVDLGTRAATTMTATGTSSERPSAVFTVPSDDEKPIVTHTAHPTAASLFWLGAHLWGRTLHIDDTVAVPWTPTGATEPQLWFHYTIVRAETTTHAEPGGTGTPGHAHESQQRQPYALVAEVEVHDLSGKSRTWTLRFHQDSPYPAWLQLTRNTHASVDPNLLPPEIVWQNGRLLSRGDGTIVWPDGPLSSLPEAPGWSHSVYRIDERPASPMLDTLPIYPLSAAIEELALLEPGFRDWWYAAPRALLVQASLVPRLVQSDLGLGMEYQWTLTFLRDGSVRSWTVARAATGPEAIAPNAHRAEPASGSAGIPSAMRTMPVGHTTTPLSSGDRLAEALEQIGVTGAIDHVHYRLTLRQTGGLGGTLLVGATHLPDAPESLRPPAVAGHLVMDLNSGAVMSSLVHH